MKNSIPLVDDVDEMSEPVFAKVVAHEIVNLDVLMTMTCRTCHAKYNLIMVKYTEEGDPICPTCGN